MGICELCGHNFSSVSNLNKHKRKVHGEVPEAKENYLPCDLCTKKFSSTSTLNRHLRQTHQNVSVDSSKRKRNSDSKGEEDEPPAKKQSEEAVCPYCDKDFSSKSVLNRHIKNIHSIEPSFEQIQGKMKCPIDLCTVHVSCYLHLDKHIQQEHALELETQEIHFQTNAEFEDWKRGEEEEMKSYFATRSSSYKKIYYRCHRSGLTRQQGSGQRLMWKENVKLGSTCPARMHVTWEDDGVHVVYTRTHVGHIPSVKFLRLTKADRAELAGKILAGESIKFILQSLRNKTSNLERIHGTERKDLSNIIRDFHLNTSRLHQNDSISVDIWVKRQQDLPNDDCCVLYYKPQGMKVANVGIKEEDFILVIMTTYQREEMTQFTSSRILIDDTHGTTGYSFHLTTLVTIDEYGAGCPVAFCISSRIDGHMMTCFLESVKARVGKISTKVFMSDDAPAFINAWTNVMGAPEKRLLCTWHVDKNWKENLPKIKDVHKQCEVYKGCRLLLEMTDQDDFENCLGAFIEMCKDDGDVKAFGEYFEKYYGMRAEDWAYCYRLGLHLNTNMFLEALHKKIKYCYLDGKVARRVDACISMLLDLSKNLMFERMIRQMKNKPTYRMQQIGSSHRRSAEVTDEMIEDVNENTWNVQSSSSARGPYTVIIDNSSCNGCPLSCPVCKLCIHQISCTCVDHLIKGNFCKHAHAVIRYTQYDGSAQGNIQTDKTEAFDNHLQIMKESLQVQPSSHVGDIDHLDKLKSYFDCVLGMASKIPPGKLPLLCKEAERLVQKAHELTEDEVLELPTAPNVPANKKIERQGFFSIKKKKKQQERHMGKPTDHQKAAIRETLLDQSANVLNVNTDFDHVYAAH